MVGVKLLTDHAALVKAARNAKHVGQFNSAAMRAGGNFRHSGLPVRPAAHLIGVAATLLGYWHDEISLFMGF